METFEILKSPIVTEKLTEEAEKLNRYGFIVSNDANKLQIKESVEKMYSVTVDSVNTMNYYGKTKSRNTKTGLVTGKKPRRKKAIVTLKKGDAIDFYSNI